MDAPGDDKAWVRRIARAETLARTTPAASGLLAFYAQLLRAQQRIAQLLSSAALAPHVLTGEMARDAPHLRAALPVLLRAIADHGPPPLADAARDLARAADEAIDELLIAQWRAPDDRAFFAKALLQPYAAQLVAGGWRIRAAGNASHRCPSCGGPPQLAILTTPQNGPATPSPSTGPGAIDSSGGRRLLCATCLGSWPTRRILCPRCGEEDEHRLAYYHAPEEAALAHVRVDACETCRGYLKSIDLTRAGLAVPLVDEVAGAALDLWARERGYTKIALNLLGV